MKQSSILRTFLSEAFIKYAAIGVTGVLIDFIIYLVLVRLGVSPLLASYISVSAGIVNNFFLNALLNFKKNDYLLRRLLSFYLVGLTGIALSLLFIFVFDTILHYGPVVAKVLSIPPIIAFQFFFNKNMSFADNPRNIPWRTLALFSLCIGVYCVFILNAPYYNFTDEADNLLGGQFIAGGGVLYSEYFSHHMPLVYFVAAALFTIAGMNLIGIKVVFGILMASWLLFMSRHLFRHVGIVTFGIFVALVAATQMLSWSHMLLGETLAAFAVAHALILFSTSSKRQSGWLDVVTYSVMGSIIILSAISYAPLAVIIYLLVLWTLFKFLLPNKLGIFAKSLAVAISAAIIALPYAVFGLYLMATRTFSEFKSQAFSFNSHFYSQYSPDSPISLLDTALSIIQGIGRSYYDVFTFQSYIPAPLIAFLFCVALLSCLAVLLRRGSYVTATVFVVVFALASSRGGAATLFSNTDSVRSSMILSIAGILLLAIICGTTLTRETRNRQAIRLHLVAPLIFVFLISLHAAATMATVGREYLRGDGTLDTPLQSGSPARVINIINDDSDYYWVGPIDFASQIKITSLPASEHRFYAPWHSKCAYCTQELLNDLIATQPRVIAFDKTLSIWGHTPSAYAPAVVEFLEQNYYQLPDPALKNFYFIKNESKSINTTLGEKGYVIN